MPTITTLASLTPGLADSYTRRALVRRIESRYWRRLNRDPTPVEIVRWLRGMGLDGAEILATLRADGRYVSWIECVIVREARALAEEDA